MMPEAIWRHQPSSSIGAEAAAHNEAGAHNEVDAHSTEDGELPYILQHTRGHSTLCNNQRSEPENLFTRLDDFS
jgi:hypothetical protein